MQILLFFIMSLLLVFAIEEHSVQNKDYTNSTAKTIAEQMSYYHYLAVKQCQETQSVVTSAYQFSSRTSGGCPDGVINVILPDSLQLVANNYKNIVSVYITNGSGQESLSQVFQEHDLMYQETQNNMNALIATGGNDKNSLPYAPARHNESNQSYVITYYNNGSNSSSWEHIYGLIASQLNGDNLKTYSGSWDNTIQGFYRNIQYSMNYASPYNVNQYDGNLPIENSTQNTPVHTMSPILYGGSGGQNIPNGAPAIITYVSVYKTNLKNSNEGFSYTQN